MNPTNLLIDDLVLDKAGVDQVSGVLQDWMTQAKVNRKNVLRCRLAAESLLEDICFHFERKLHVSVEVRRQGETIAARQMTVIFSKEMYRRNLRESLLFTGVCPRWKTM